MGRAERAVRFCANRSAAQNSAGMVAPTWVCCQFVQLTMKPDAAKITPPTSPAAGDSRSRRTNR